MKRKLIMTGIIAAVSLTSMSFGAFAASNLEEVKSYLNKGLSLKMNGQTWQAKDADGNSQYPITYEGSTYLPVRAVGEALGVKIGFDGATNTVLIGEGGEADKAEPPAVPASEKSTRSNPVKIGSKQNFAVDGILDSYKGTVSVDEVIRGDEAWKQIKAANQFNKEAKEGYEYVLAKISIKIDENKKEGAQVNVSTSNFKLVSSEGKDYDPLIGVVVDQNINAKLYAGASHTGWAAFQVKKDDQNPLITYGRESDGSGGVWFVTK